MLLATTRGLPPCQPAPSGTSRHECRARQGARCRRRVRSSQGCRRRACRAPPPHPFCIPCRNFQTLEGCKATRAKERLRRHLASTPPSQLPRCWLRGAQFADASICNFLFAEKHAVPLPAFIEIDHVVPHTHGGGNGNNNLALACGWCNQYKSSLSSVYDVQGRSRISGRNELGLKTLAQPFWTVRLLGVARSCEHHSGCTTSSDNANMTIEPVNHAGALDPSNLKVICFEHDDMRDVRLQPARIVRELWSRDALQY
jgi:hypothetical protein